ncbi:MAG: cation-transporting P-type ATPase, partial [Bacilli bacterium]
MKKLLFKKKKTTKHTTEKSNIERFLPSPQHGLSAEQVAERIADKLTNVTKGRLTKSYWEIIRTNVFSIFNILLYIIAAAMIAVQYY